VARINSGPTLSFRFKNRKGKPREKVCRWKRVCLFAAARPRTIAACSRDFHESMRGGVLRWVMEFTSVRGAPNPLAEGKICQETRSQRAAGNVARDSVARGAGGIVGLNRNVRLVEIKLNPEELPTPLATESRATLPAPPSGNSNLSFRAVRPSSEADGRPPKQVCKKVRPARESAGGLPPFASYGGVLERPSVQSLSTGPFTTRPARKGG